MENSEFISGLITRKKNRVIRTTNSEKRKFGSYKLNENNISNKWIRIKYTSKYWAKESIIKRSNVKDSTEKEE